MPPICYSKMPIIDTLSGNICGYEVLLRQCAQQNLSQFNQQPNLFIKHHNQLIDALKALDKSHKIRAKGQKLFLNLLPEQLVSQQAVYALQSLQNLPHYPLVIEMTEASLKQSTEQVRASVELLKKKGCQLAIDDFGSLESNFLRVLTLCPDYIKLDKTFIQTNNHQQKQIDKLKYLVAFFQKLGSLVIIEGIESQQEYLIAKQIKADYVQGFYFGHPEPI